VTHRVSAFFAIGVAGFVLQIVLLHWLSSGWHWPYVLATLVAVESAILHNFFWHERWTWADRRSDARSTRKRLLRFHLGTGMTSLVGNVVVTALAVEFLHLPTLVANTLAVMATSLVNYLVSDRWVFGRSAAAACFLALVLAPADASAAGASRETVSAWNRHISAIEMAAGDHATDPPVTKPEGRSIPVTGGTIHEWRGSVLVRGITVPRLVGALEVPGLPPPSDDVLDARVLRRDGDLLHVYLRLTRSAVMTVTYDTEHDVTFIHHYPALATSRSVSTTVREVGDSDHGFLWALNSYWRYRQQGDDVLVEVLSVSLSRDVPSLVRPIAAPVIDHVARESMQRTLDAVERFGTGLRAPRSAVESGATR
jgi:putative flippase GtrA